MRYLNMLHWNRNSVTKSLLLLLCLAVAPCMMGQQTNEQMASYYYQNKEYDKAIELYEPLYQRTQNLYYYQMLYQSYVALDDMKKARKLVEQRIKKYPRELALRVDLGQLYMAEGDKKRAEKTYNNAIESIGFDNKQIEDLCQAFQSVGLEDWAIKTYQYARKKMNNNFLFVMELATLYERQGNYEAMMQEYFGLLDKEPRMMGSVQISLQRALDQTSNPQLAEGLRRTLIDRIQKDPNNRTFLDMMIWFSLQQKDFAFAFTQAKAVDVRFPGQGEETILQVAQIALNNGDFNTAYESYHYLVTKGKDGNFYFDARVGELKTKFERLDKNFYLAPKDYMALKSEYESALSELGKELRTVPLMRDYAYLLAYYGNEVQMASDLLYDVVEMPKLTNNIKSQTKLELGDLLLFAGAIWDASLLYSQVEKANKNDVVGAQAKFKNAKLSYYNNDFEWAKSQLDVLRASTSKLIANDAMELSLLISDNMEEDSTFEMLSRYAAADLMLYRNQLDSAWDAFNDITIRSLSHPLLDEVLMQKAKIRMKQGRYAEADSLLQQIVDFYAEDILADDAVMMIAEMNDSQLNNIERARSYYEKLILDYPASLYVERARKRYNELKAAIKS
ncbi:MAG: tetratricopeptide repeat protein [Bacteroidales bacterium]|nr:tetratricopeptide repeat protein [Bacteroidales bacterium]